MNFRWRNVRLTERSLHNREASRAPRLERNEVIFGGKNEERDGRGGPGVRQKYDLTIICRFVVIVSDKVFLTMIILQHTPH